MNASDAVTRLAELEAEVAALRAELAETNQGVLALYAELDDKAVELKAASDLKSRFLSYMSHEFRTPLGSILSIARLLIDRLDGPLTDEQERQVRFIQSSATELTEMVNDLLDLAKVEAGRITISPAWFEMPDLRRSIVAGPQLDRGTGRDRSPADRPDAVHRRLSGGGL